MNKIERLKEQLTIFCGSDVFDSDHNISLATLKEFGLCGSSFLEYMNDSLKEMFGIKNVFWLERPNFRLKKDGETWPVGSIPMKVLFDQEYIDRYQKKYSNKSLYLYSLTKISKHNMHSVIDGYIDSPVVGGLRINYSPLLFDDSVLQTKISILMDRNNFTKTTMTAAINHLCDFPNYYNVKAGFCMILTGIFLDSHQEPFYE